MAGQINYGLVQPNIANYALQEQTQLSNQKAKLDIERLESERKIMLDFQKQLADSGKNPDLNAVFDVMIKSGNPDYVAKGLEGKSKLQEQRQFAEIMGYDMTPPSAAAPTARPTVAPTTAPMGAPTTAPAVPMAPVNALAPQGMSDEANRLTQQINGLLRLGTPQALNTAKVLQTQLTALEPTPAIKEFRFGQKVPEFTQYQMNKARAGASQVVLPAQEKAFEAELGKGQADRILKSKEGAESAAAILQTNQVGRDILKSGAITGAGADFFVGLNQALKTAGIDFGFADAAANSQAYAAAMGQNTAQLIKQFGAGTGLSDADREYATKIAGGSINLDEKAIRKILDINDRAARNVINRHNQSVEGIKTNIPLKVSATPTVAPPAGAIEMLRKNPSLAKQFDDKYGAGAAASVLGR